MNAQVSRSPLTSGPGPRPSDTSTRRASSLNGDHVVIEPSVLYFGTPVSLVSTCNPDGSANLAPISSSWFVGKSIVLGLGDGGQTLHNLRGDPGFVLNLPSTAQQDAVERLAPLTGRFPVPSEKQAQFRFERAKFQAAGLTEQLSEFVRAPRAAECPVQIEATVENIHATAEEGFAIVEARALRVHALAELVIPATHHIDTARWRPLFYVFRHYFGLGADLGKNFRAE